MFFEVQIAASPGSMKASFSSTCASWPLFFYGYFLPYSRQSLIRSAEKVAALQLMIMKENGRIALPCSRKIQRTYVKCTPKESEREFNSSLKHHGAFFFGGGGVGAEITWRRQPRFDFQIANISKTVDRTKLRHTPSVSASQALQNIKILFLPELHR